MILDDNNMEDKAIWARTMSGGTVTGILQVAAGQYHTVVVKSDGTVVAVGSNYSGQCEVDSWSDLQRVAAGDCHTVGVMSDGNMVAVGSTVLACALL